MFECPDPEDALPTEIFVLLDRHLPQFLQLEHLFAGCDLEFEPRTQQWLEAILVDSDALSFASEGIPHLFASLIMFLQTRTNISNRPFGGERLEKCVQAAASFAMVRADDVKECLWAADCSLRASLDDLSAPQKIPYHGTPPPAPASCAITVMKGSLE